MAIRAIIQDDFVLVLSENSLGGSSNELFQSVGGDAQNFGII